MLPPLGSILTPQRLHAELLATDAKGLEAYLQGALVNAGSHRRFMSVVGSWHPRKRQQMNTRMKI
jgi:hypothetical protein